MADQPPEAHGWVPFATNQLAVHEVGFGSTTVKRDRSQSRRRSVVEGLMSRCGRIMCGVAAGGFDVERAECLVNGVAGHCCLPSTAHRPGGFLGFVSTAMIPCVLAFLLPPYLVYPVVDVVCKNRSHGIR